jgi:hypothetical protein
MEKNLHNIDEAFNKAYQSYEDEPSAGAWEKMSAALDKEDAEKYKRRFIGWKRIAVMLLFLLAGFMIYETGVVIKRRNPKELVKKENITDSAFAPDNTNDYQKKTSAETKTNQQDANKPVTTFENPGQLQPSEVLIETNEKVITAPKSNQQIIIVVEQSEIDINTSKIKKANKQLAKNKNKITIRPDEIAEDETGSIADNNSATNKKGNSKIKDNQTAIVSDMETDSIRKLFISPITSISRIEISKPAITELAIKQPVLPVINTTSNIAQSKKKKSSSFKPFWSVTAFASNDWGQYTIDNDVHDNTGNQQDEKEEINRREKHEGSYSGGVFATRQFTKHLGLKTGLIYSNTAIGISPQEMYASKKTDGSVAYKYITSSGYGFVKPGFGLPPAVGDSIQSTEAQHNLQTLSIPLMVSYRFDKKKFSVIPAVGLSANFITSANVTTEVTDALNKESVTINGLDGMRSFYTGLIADVSLQYNYNSKWSFSLLPGFKYALTPITKGNVVKTFPYSFNMGAGVTYKF